MIQTFVNKSCVRKFKVRKYLRNQRIDNHLKIAFLITFTSYKYLKLSPHQSEGKILTGNRYEKMEKEELFAQMKRCFILSLFYTKERNW